MIKLPLRPDGVIIYFRANVSDLREPASGDSLSGGSENCFSLGRSFSPAPHGATTNKVVRSVPVRASLSPRLFCFLSSPNVGDLREPASGDSLIDWVGSFALTVVSRGTQCHAIRKRLGLCSAALRAAVCCFSANQSFFIVPERLAGRNAAPSTTDIQPPAGIRYAAGKGLPALPKLRAWQSQTGT